MLTYIARVKTAAKQLTNTAEMVSTTNLLNKTICGLNDCYEAVKVYLGMDSALTEERLTQVLMAEESRKLMTGDEKERGRERERSREISRERERSRERGRETERSRGTYREWSDRHNLGGRSRSHDRRRSTSRSMPTPVRQRSPPRSPKSSGRRNKFCRTCNMFGHDEETCFRLHPELLAKRQAEQAQKCPQYPNNIWSQPRGTFQQQIFPAQPTSVPSSQQAAYLELNQTQQRPQNAPPQQHAQGYAMPVQLNEDTVWDYYHTAMTMGQPDIKWDEQLNDDTVWGYYHYHTAMTMGQTGIDWDKVLLAACKKSCEGMTVEELRDYWSTHFIIPPHMMAMIIEADLRSCVALHRYNLAVATEEAACWSAQDPRKPFVMESENEAKGTKLSTGDYIQVPQYG